jgi:ribonucleoside-diphosphate reductase alpha chain
MIYTLEEVKKKTLEYFGGDDLATNVWIDKYCLKNLNGEFVEDSPLMMYKRIAEEFSRIEEKYPNPINYNEIRKLLEGQVLLPGGSLLFGIGNNYSISSLGNCFVIGNTSDSYGGILQTDQEQVQLMKRRAGVGHDISHLRAKGVPTTNSARTSSGIVPFMDRYSNSTREVAQDGRRGALMLSCDINHPQAEDFITAKDDSTKVTGANVSVKVNHEFMIGVVEKDILNIKLWNKLIHQAWKTAEPGLLFWDTIVNESPADCYISNSFSSTSTNPCGEIPLCPYDSCRLLSINLTKYVKFPFTDKAYFDWGQFKHDVYTAQKLMDDVVDLEEEKINVILNKIENDPEPESIKLIEKNLWIKIKEKLLQGRRTGLSGIGLADTLAMLNISYSDGINMAESIYKSLAITAYQSSIDMAKERGAFPIWNWDVEKNNPFIQRVIVYKAFDLDYIQYGRRNIALLTIPPSGTISLLAGISSGVEPVYQLHYKRRRKVNPDHTNITFVDKNGDCWEEYIVYHPKFKEWIKIEYKTITDDDINIFDVKTLEDFIFKSPWHSSTAYELNPINRIKMQGRIQKWVDHSISSTINLPETATEEDVSNIYIEAWKQGCKGITMKCTSPHMVTCG